LCQEFIKKIQLKRAWCGKRKKFIIPLLPVYRNRKYMMKNYFIIKESLYHDPGEGARRADEGMRMRACGLAIKKAALFGQPFL